MKLSTLRFGRAVSGLVLGSALTLTTAMPAFAADDTNVTVEPGNLVFTAAPTVGDMSNVQLDGTDKTATGTISAFSVTDARGSGAGWKVSISAQPFKEYANGAYVDSGKTLATNALSLTPPTLTSGGDGTGLAAAPTLTTGTQTLTTTPVVLASAAANTGMATTFGFSSSSLSLAVPATTYAAMYRSDVTIDVQSGPN